MLVEDDRRHPSDLGGCMIGCSPVGQAPQLPPAQANTTGGDNQDHDPESDGLKSGHGLSFDEDTSGPAGWALWSVSFKLTASHTTR